MLLLVATISAGQPFCNATAHVKHFNLQSVIAMVIPFSNWFKLKKEGSLEGQNLDKCRMIDAVTKLVVTSLEMFLDKYVCHENV